MDSDFLERFVHKAAETNFHLGTHIKWAAAGPENIF